MWWGPKKPKPDFEREALSHMIEVQKTKINKLREAAESLSTEVLKDTLDKKHE